MKHCCHRANCLISTITCVKECETLQYTGKRTYSKPVIFFIYYRYNLYLHIIQFDTKPPIFFYYYIWATCKSAAATVLPLWLSFLFILTYRQLIHFENGFRYFPQKTELEMPPHVYHVLTAWCKMFKSFRSYVEFKNDTKDNFILRFWHDNLRGTKKPSTAAKRPETAARTFLLLFFLVHVRRSCWLKLRHKHGFVNGNSHRSS